MFSSMLNQFNFLSTNKDSQMTTKSKPETPFGKQFREKYFSNQDPEVLLLNNGSYGTVPSPIHNKFVESMLNTSSYPDLHMKYNLKDTYIESLKVIGKVLNCDYHNLAIVENATTGINTVLRSYPFKKGDSLVIQSTVYGACGNTVKFLKDNYDIDFHVVEINYPTTDAEILAKFEKVFKEVKPKLCMFDTVTSMPGVIFPHEQMIKLCDKYKILSLVDGAHGIGCIPQNLSKLKPSFYVSNLHKWFYVPFGCAVLYIDPKYQKGIHTLPISHSYLKSDTILSEEDEKNRMIERFWFIGTKNFASVATIPDAYKFRNEICGGEETIYEYCHNLAVQAGDLVSKKWGTFVLDQPNKTQISTMVTIAVPTDKYPEFVKNWSKYDNLVYKKCFDKKAYIPCASHNGKLFARLSAQVYNELNDYDLGSDILIQALDEVAKENDLLV
ncbi:uncharacterized protein KGF55_000795 [Candida pseudojiufengensis]|uniref:uncharacterized protein n=1 Tax=Candida pseudojiufengensis TaxID=497109 RepID=UPI0022257D51|nr:uncharacterized protein KGF55_000795 [Candida pseudojiufengensis]KAI5966486.1 hypothetical protein KGF55_000795 [Candida pseudojiufengensis]